MANVTPMAIIKNMWPRKPWRGRLVVFTVDACCPQKMEIKIHAVHRWDPVKQVDRIRYYEVNWAAVGGVRSSIARQHAIALIFAAKETERLTKLYGGRKWS